MPDLSSTRRVRRVCRFDGRTRVTRVRRGGTWERLHRSMRLTPANVRRLKQQKVTEVELRRWLRHARLPMTWLYRHFS